MRWVCLLGMLLVGCLHPGGGGASADAGSVQGRACNPPTRIELVREGSIGAKWNPATQTLAYGRPGADGRYDIYLADASAQNERRLTHPGWRDDRHQWAEEWAPSGKFLFALVEKAGYRPGAVPPSHPRDASLGTGATRTSGPSRSTGRRRGSCTRRPTTTTTASSTARCRPTESSSPGPSVCSAANFLDLNLAAGAYVFKVADVSKDHRRG